MVKQDSFERMVTGISDEERQSILNQMQSANGETTSPLHPVEEKVDDISEPFEIRIKNESFFIKFLVWLKAILSNTTQKTIYNELKISEISHYIEKNFPGIISSKKGKLLSPFYDRLTELKACADFFRPYFIPLEDDDGSFYVYLSSLVMPEITSEITAEVDPYSNPVTPVIKPDQRSSLLRNMEEIFNNIPQIEKTRMYQAAKACEWLKQFTRLSFSRFLTFFTATSEDGYSCPFTQVESEVDTFAKNLCSSIDIPDEFLEALYMFAIRNSRRSSDEETGREAGEFLSKAHSNLGLLQLFMSSVPIRSLSCLIHNNWEWRTEVFSAGEDWFVKYKNALKKIFDKKWISWESDCKRQALLLTLKTNFDLDSFPRFPERPWEELWGGVHFSYESTLSFLNWFITEKFPVCELDLKTLLVQGAFNKEENHVMLNEAFNAMVQLSISFQSLSRRLSINGETGAMFNKIREDKSRTLQAQNKVDQMIRTLESDVSTLIHRFGDSARAILKVLYGVLGLSKDPRFDTVKNLNSMKDKNNEPFIKRIELSKNLIESALNLVIEIESLDKQRSK